MNTQRKIKFYCDEHEEQLNIICIDPKCKNKGLICAQDLFQKHNGHKVMDILSFIQEYKILLEENKEKNNQKMIKSKNPNIYNKLQEKGEDALKILENFKSFIIQYIDSCKEDLEQSIKRKKKLLKQNQVLQEEQIIDDFETNNISTADEAIRNIQVLVNKVKNTNEKNQHLIIEWKDYSSKAQDESLKLQIEALEQTNSDISLKLQRQMQNIMSTIDMYKSDNIISQDVSQIMHDKEINEEENIQSNKKNKMILEDQQQESDDEDSNEKFKRNFFNNNNKNNNNLLLENENSNMIHNSINTNSSLNNNINNNNNDSFNNLSHYLDKYNILENNNNKQQQQQKKQKFKLEQNDSDSDENQDQIQKPRFAQPLKPYHKKNDIQLTQIEQDIKNKKQIQNQKSDFIVNKNIANNYQQKQQQNINQSKQLVKIAQHGVEQGNTALKNKQKEQVSDSLENLFNSQSLAYLQGSKTLKKQEEIQENQQNPYKNMFKIEENDDDFDIDQKALQDLQYQSQQNQENFYLKHNQSLQNIDPNELGEISLDIKHKKPITASRNTIRDILFIDNNTIASCGFDQVIRIWTVQGKKLYSLKQHTDIVQQIAYSSNLNLLASVGKDCSIILYDQNKNFEVKIQQNVNYKSKDDGIYCVKFLEQQEKIITGGADRKFIIWQIQKNILKESAVFLNKNDICFQIIYSPIRQQFISGGTKNLSIWKIQENDSNSKKKKLKQEKCKEIEPIKNILAHKDYINEIVCLIINDSPVIISASDDKTCKIFDAISYKLIKQFTENCEISSLCYIDMTNILVVGLWGNTGEGGVCFWDVSDEEPEKIQEVQQVKRGTTAVRTNQDNSYLISSHENGNLEVFQLNYELLPSEQQNQ